MRCNERACMSWIGATHHSVGLAIERDCTEEHRSIHALVKQLAGSHLPTLILPEASQALRVRIRCIAHTVE